MNQNQLLREAVTSGMSLEQAKTWPCSSIKHIPLTVSDLSNLSYPRR